ncbi:Aldehyde Dehydrogenase [Arcobacter nitrofigilis DSM 7299]|uniref:Aldehyde Dehydrogenase n=1 Tax=Arcobacter nitrofigilis (strain ATCC 33309 / DSM 7299 / CCUG 15893 / LMG 7604 / NCTC 12251 / CI) TaxID=572480 RepID=D5V2V9_ARCNC|nr:aldehyde dehydrogenase family protein [Arcobacter nitrofigilis]ADG92541.1 Aldehyde Dehydrogenase [Arcobacter nitrofigilis DSM 7299]
MKNLKQDELIKSNNLEINTNEPMKNFICGEWKGSEEIAQNINPSDITDIVSTYYKGSFEHVTQTIEFASQVQKSWAKSSISLREEILKDIAEKLLDNKDYYGEIIAREAGKPIKEATDEVVKSAEFFNYFAAEAIRMKGAFMDSPRDNVDIEVIHEPIGVIGVITPWNYPLAIPAWKIAPALAYGNSVILKPSSNTPAIAHILAKIIDSTKLPKGVFSLTFGQGGVIGDTLAQSKKVQGITFTGSVAVGKELAKKSIDSMTKLQLEMGSKNSLIILDDADINTAVEASIKGAYNANGQKCTSCSKLIVTEGIYEEFLAAFKNKMQSLVVGNAMNPSSQIGPCIDKKQLDANLEYIKLGQEEGATLVCGGEAIKTDTQGFYFSPALFVDGKSSMRINQEEMFAAIACVIKVKDYDEAIEVLNDTEFGLSGGIITNDLKKSMQFKHDAEIGNVMINLPTAGMDNHVPFGGRKNSSYGSREKSYTASDFYTTTKTVYIKY